MEAKKRDRRKARTFKNTQHGIRKSSVRAVPPSEAKVLFLGTFRKANQWSMNF